MCLDPLLFAPLKETTHMSPWPEHMFMQQALEAM